MTHDQKVLALLSDRQPHSHTEIYGLHVVGHSRVASLRSKGYGIEQYRDGDDYMYLLVSTPEEAASAAAASSGAEVTAATRESSAEPAAPIYIEGQLSVFDALGAVA